MKAYLRFLTTVLALAAVSTVALADTTSYTKTVMPSGLTVIVKPEPGIGIVAVEVFVRAGAEQEREYNAGIGNLVASTLLASTRNKRAETVAGVIEGVGGNFATEWNPDYTEIKAVTTTSGFDEATSLLGDILNNANFEKKWVDQSRMSLLQDMSAGSDDVFTTTYDLLRGKLYRDNPYRRPNLGYDRAVSSITTDDMARFYQQYYVPNNIVVSIAGDVTPEHARDRMRIAFAGTSPKALPKLRPIPEETLEASTSQVIERPIKAAYFMFGFLAPGMESPDYPAAQVASSALGSGKGSRMFQVLREQKGLAYEVGTMYPPLKHQSHMVAYLITDPYRRIGPGYNVQMLLSEIKKATLGEINRLQDEPLSAAELKRAKRYTIGSYTLRHQRLKDRAFHLGWLEAVGMGCEYDTGFEAKIESVTAEDVKRVARKYLNNYALIIVLPERRNEE